MIEDAPATVWLAMAQGVTPVPGDTARIVQHWQADHALLDRAVAGYETASGQPFFDLAAAAFAPMVRAR